jgi:hypothetical protein
MISGPRTRLAIGAMSRTKSKPGFSLKRVTISNLTADEEREMPTRAKRRKATRKPPRAPGLREIRLVVPDARSPSVRKRVAAEVARLEPRHEDDALTWTEAVSEFDNLDPPDQEKGSA